MAASWTFGANYLHLDSRTVMQIRSLSSGNSIPGGYQKERLGYSSRKPQRITITMSHGVHEALVEESNRQGRSLSNLASFWLEQQASNSKLNSQQSTHLARS